MAESSFNPLNALTNFFGGSSHSRLSSNLASIHHHVSQELEPDYFTEWEKSQQKRHRSDTTKSSSSSLFSHLSHDPITTRMYSALEDDKGAMQDVEGSEAKLVVRNRLPSNQTASVPPAPVRKSAWSWPALDTIQVHAQSISVPTGSDCTSSTTVETQTK